jgi:hypothetical protein
MLMNLQVSKYNVDMSISWNSIVNIFENVVVANSLY